MFGGVERGIHLIGIESGGVPVIGAGVALKQGMGGSAMETGGLKSLTVVRGLGTYVTAVPYQKEFLGIMVPGILRKSGDVADWLRGMGPLPLTLAGMRGPGGEGLSQEESEALWRGLREAYAGSGQSAQLVIGEGLTSEEIVSRLSAIG